MSEPGRWARRNIAMDAARHRVWTVLENTGTASGDGPPRAGVDWDNVRPDLFENTPFLTERKPRMVARRKAG